MAQAAGITTAIRQLMSRGRSLKSTSPVRQAHTEFIDALAGNAPHPIRELMSRGQPPKSTSPVRLAHSEFVAALAGNIPHPIYAGANADDVDHRADHLEKVFGALHAYLAVLIGDTAQNIPGGALDRRDLDSLFQDLSADAVGIIRSAAEKLRENENWRAP